MSKGTLIKLNITLATVIRSEPGLLASLTPGHSQVPAKSLMTGPEISGKMSHFVIPLIIAGEIWETFWGKHHDTNKSRSFDQAL